MKDHAIAPKNTSVLTPVFQEPGPVAAPKTEKNVSIVTPVDPVPQHPEPEPEPEPRPPSKSTFDMC